jgi:hypothetical protein
MELSPFLIGTSKNPTHLLIDINPSPNLHPNESGR